MTWPEIKSWALTQLNRAGTPNLHPGKCTNSQCTVSFDEVHSHVTTTTRRARPFLSHQEPGYLEVGGELQDHPSPRPFLLRMGSRDPGQDSDLFKLTAQSVGFISSTSLTSPLSLQLLSRSQFLQEDISPNHVLGPSFTRSSEDPASPLSCPRPQTS